MVQRLFEKPYQAFIRKPWWSVVIAVVIYMAVAAVATWPFVGAPDSTLTGPWAGDVSSSVTRWQAVVASHANPFASPTLHYIAYPDGIKNNVGVSRVSFLSELYLWVGSLTIGPIATHSLQTFLGYFLTALLTFLFVRAVTRSTLAGLVAGLVYGFWPHMYAMGHADATYTHMWLFVLPVWAFWLLMTREWRWWRAALAIAAIVPGMWWTPYFMFHVIIVGLACLTVALIYGLRRWGWKRTLLLGVAALVSWAGMLALYRYVGLSSNATEVPVRTMEEIYQQSANPLMFVIPGEYSFGREIGYEQLLKWVPRARETNLYVGWSVLLLALITTVALLWPRTMRPQARIAGWMGLLVVMGCFIFSLPPTFYWSHHVIPTPNWLVAHTVPALRAGQRFVMPLMGGLAVLAGMGCWILVRKLGLVWRVALTSLVLLIVGVDLMAIPPDAVTVIPHYPALAALASRPDDVTAYYQEGSLAAYPGERPCLLQPQFHKTLINDCGVGRPYEDPGRPTPHLAGIVAMPICDQLSALKALGTKYLVVEQTFRDKPVFDCIAQQGNAMAVIAQDNAMMVVELR